MVLASILTYIVTTPIFKVKEAEGKVCYKEDGSPEFITDDDGNKVINAEDVDRVINKDHPNRLKDDEKYREQCLV
ncbi:MAG: hypothetical protein Q4A11_03560 [Brachymonas sp.]|nr:hypothetical protein [Brachymonas sp.]